MQSLSPQAIIKTNQCSSKTDRMSHQERIYNRYFYYRSAEHQLLQEENQKHWRELANTPKLTLNSYLILCDKLEANIQDQIDKNHDERGMISFEQMGIIISNLNPFISSLNHNFEQKKWHLFSQIWLVLCCYQIEAYTKSCLLFSFLRIAMDPYSLSYQEVKSMLKEVKKFSNLDEERQKFIKSNPQLADQTLKIRQIFRLWNQLKMQNQHFQRHQPTHPIQPLDLCFQPRISRKTQLFAEQARKRYYSSTHQPDELLPYLQGKAKDRCSLDKFELLHKHTLAKDNLKPAPPESPISQKKLWPEEVNLLVNNLYVKKQRRHEVDFHLRDEQQQLKKCTFKPKITSYRPSNPLSVRNYQKEVSRLQKARKEKQRIKELENNLGKPKRYTQQSQAPSFLERDTPRLILQISISESRMEKIKLKGDEDPKLVAKKFVCKHGLQESMQSVLEELVGDQLEQLTS